MCTSSDLLPNSGYDLDSHFGFVFSAVNKTLKLHLDPPPQPYLTDYFTSLMDSAYFLLPLPGPVQSDLGGEAGAHLDQCHAGPTHGMATPENYFLGGGIGILAELIQPDTDSSMTAAHT